MLCASVLTILRRWCNCYLKQYLLVSVISNNIIVGMHKEKLYSTGEAARLRNLIHHHKALDLR
jgi:hypothetical protein